MIIGLQYYSGDEAKALSLARFLADTIPVKVDHHLVLSRSFDTPMSEELARTRNYCARKFHTITIQSRRRCVGYPDGAYGNWAGMVEKLAKMRRKGHLPWQHHSVFCAEADGAPVCRDWLEKLEAAHNLSLALGKRVTGPVMDKPWPHVNGNLILHLSAWDDHHGLHSCSPLVAWDIFHAQILLTEARASNVIRNEHGTSEWTSGALAAIGRETAWISNVKDDSVLRFARRLFL